MLIRRTLRRMSILRRDAGNEGPAAALPTTKRFRLRMTKGGFENTFKRLSSRAPVPVTARKPVGFVKSF